MGRPVGPTQVAAHNVRLSKLQMKMHPTPIPIDRCACEGAFRGGGLDDLYSALC